MDRGAREGLDLVCEIGSALRASKSARGFDRIGTRICIVYRFNFASRMFRMRLYTIASFIFHTRMRVDVDLGIRIITPIE